MESKNQQEIFDLNKLKLIVGLGNVGREYENTRHNIGFDFLDSISGNIKFENTQKLKSLLLRKSMREQKFILCKPTTLMNSSGEAVVLVSKYYNIEPNEILVVHDDLDINLGSYKLHFAKGPKVHNGLISIENRLGTNKFWRLRIGIDNRDVEYRNQIEPHDYVLSRFKSDEMKVVDEVIFKINEEVF